MPPTTSSQRADSSPIQAVLGNDSAKVSRTAAELAIRMAPADGDEFATDVIGGASESVDEAVTRIHQTSEALLTLPFFGGGKLVWLKNANFLGDDVTGKSESVKEALESLATTLEGGLGAEVRFLISATQVDKRKTFYKRLIKQANVQVFDKIDASRAGWEDMLAAQVKIDAAALDVTFTREAMELFILLVGTDTRQIENELEKLYLSLGKERQQIEVEDVKLLVPHSHAGVIWEISNAVSGRRLDESLKLVDHFLSRGESAIGILLAAIIPTVRKLLYVKDIMVRFRLKPPAQPNYFGSALKNVPAEFTSHLPKKKDGTPNTYALGFTAMDAGRFKLKELLDGMEACLHANLQLVTSSADPKTVLCQLIVKLLGTTR